MAVVRSHERGHYKVCEQSEQRTNFQGTFCAGHVLNFGTSQVPTSAILNKTKPSPFVASELGSGAMPMNVRQLRWFAKLQTPLVDPMALSGMDVAEQHPVSLP